MAKKPKRDEIRALQRPRRAKLSPAESLKRMEEFPKREEAFVAAVRKGKNRGLSA